MGELSFFKSFLLLAAVFLIFSGSQADIHGQTGYYLEELTDIDYKWAVQQKWDKTTGDWNDTLSVTYIIPGANGKPSEIFTHNYDPIVGDMREVITYKDDKKMNLVAYMKDSLSGEFQKEPYCIQTFWYTEDILAKYEIVIDLSKTSFSEKIKYHIEKGYRPGNQRIAADSTLIKYSGSEEELARLGFSTEDTTWTLIERSDYLYSGNSLVTLIYRGKESSPFGKDSTVIIGEKLSEIHGFASEEGEWIATSLIKIVYDGDLITQMIYQERENDSLVNQDRTLFFHTPYPFSGTKHLSSSHKTNRINAFVSENNGFYMVNLSLNQSSEVSIYLTDLKGRKLGNAVRRRVMPGSSSLSLSVSSPGKYLCYIISGQERAVVPFTKLK